MKARTWTFGALVGLLAAGDWFALPVPADGEGDKPALRIGKTVVTAVVRDVEIDKKTEPHFFLEATGACEGPITVRLLKTPKASPVSRMPALPVAEWEKRVEIGTKPVDLGVVPTEAKGTTHRLEASGDGKTFAWLWWSGNIDE